MAESKTRATGSIIDIPKIKTNTIEIYILGQSPLLCNRLSEKAKHELLAPRGRKTGAARQATLKHDPYAEFRAAPYTLVVPDDVIPPPTYLALMSSAFKGAMSTAALDLPGAKKAQIGRLVWVQGQYTPVYGKPYLHMGPVRSAGIDRTPDIRTRVIIPEWACVIGVTFVETLIKAPAIFNLLAAAGLTAGVGDWRNEKGKGTFGQFSVTNKSDERLRPILLQGREAQIAAMERAEAYDEETQELLDWWTAETRERRFIMPEPEHAIDPDDELEDSEEDQHVSSNGMPV